MKNQNELIGFLVLDKPAGITSHDVVDRVRKRLGTRKVGHLGTLDPMATGVLPVTVGKATRLGRFVSPTTKEYTGAIRLGLETTTCDAEGEPVGPERPVRLSADQVAEVMKRFLGPIEQVPPAYSAKKISGVPAYRLARKGIPVELSAARVRIDSLELTRWDSPDLEFHVECSQGTYIRSLARDLGARLDTGAHLRTLRRIRSGPFRVDDAVAPDEAGPEHLRGPGQVLESLPRIEVGDSGEKAVAEGRALECPGTIAPDGADLCIFNKKGRLIAVARVDRGWAHPKVVLI